MDIIRNRLIFQNPHSAQRQYMRCIEYMVLSVMNIGWVYHFDNVRKIGTILCLLFIFELLKLQDE